MRGFRYRPISVTVQASRSSPALAPWPKFGLSVFACSDPPSGDPEGPGSQPSPSPSLSYKFGRRVVAGERIGLRRLQIPRQQLVNTVDRMIGDALEHRADKRLGVVAVEFGAAQQAVDRRSSLTAGIAAGE